MCFAEGDATSHLEQRITAMHGFVGLINEKQRTPNS